MQTGNIFCRGEFGLEMQGVNLIFRPNYLCLSQWLKSGKVPLNVGVGGAVFRIKDEEIGAPVTLFVALRGYEARDPAIVEHTTVGFRGFSDDFRDELFKPCGVLVSGVTLSISVSKDGKRRALQVSRMG